MKDFKDSLQATKKRLKPYKISLALVTRSKGAVPLLYITWGSKFTPNPLLWINQLRSERGKKALLVCYI